ncbi:MAG: hypothetical protein A3F17_03910 [Gammaproteobacteria bacterium RIFCSPHIGHO2_12_FULL_41_15]|nr:MAG: hypothetical protein A3F17_03910 [Gammaproteobacteria bacterium RIFCSPHIGHO2_12_FULL_41_15]
MKAVLAVALLLLSVSANSAPLRTLPDPFTTVERDLFLFDMGGGLYMPVAVRHHFAMFIMRHPIGGIV